jgi:hypothetical protein
MNDIMSKSETVVVWLTFAGIIAVGTMVGSLLATFVTALLIVALQ